MLQTAADATNLHAAGVAYRMHATVRFVAKNNDESVPVPDTRVTLDFAGPDRWREDILWGEGDHSIEMVAQGRTWRQNLDSRRLDLLRVDAVLDFSDSLIDPRGAKVYAAKSRKFDGQPATCIPSQFGAHDPQEVCIDAATGLPMSITANSKAMELSFAPYAYLSLGAKRFPSRIRYLVNARNTIEVTIDSLEAVDPAAQNFTPPIGALKTASVPWCANEQPSAVQHYGGAADVAQPAPAAAENSSGFKFKATDYSLFVFAVGADGRVKDLKAYDINGSLVIPDVDAAKLKGSQFAPAMCGGQPVESEFLFWAGTRPL